MVSNFILCKAAYQWDDLPLSIRSMGSFEGQWRPYYDEATKQIRIADTNLSFAESGFFNTTTQIAKRALEFRLNASATRLGTPAVRGTSLRSGNTSKTLSKSAQILFEQKQKKAHNMKGEEYVQITASLWQFPLQVGKKCRSMVLVNIFI
jgi:hypothetical protein